MLCRMGALLARFDEVKNSGLLKTDESSRELLFHFFFFFVIRFYEIISNRSEMSPSLVSSYKMFSDEVDEKVYVEIYFSLARCSKTVSRSVARRKKSCRYLYSIR